MDGLQHSNQRQTVLHAQCLLHAFLLESGSRGRFASVHGGTYPFYAETLFLNLFLLLLLFFTITFQGVFLDIFSLHHSHDKILIVQPYCISLRLSTAYLLSTLCIHMLFYIKKCLFVSQVLVLRGWYCLFANACSKAWMVSFLGSTFALVSRMLKAKFCSHTCSYILVLFSCLPKAFWTIKNSSLLLTTSFICALIKSLFKVVSI